MNQQQQVDLIYKYHYYFYSNDKQKDYARLLKTLKFPEIYREKKSYSTIKGIKEFILKDSINSNEPVCTCFLEIWKDDHKENDVTIMAFCNSSDSTYLYDTIFSDKNTLINVCIKKERVCTCGKYPLIERISRLINEHKKEKLNWEKKKIKKIVKNLIRKFKNKMKNIKMN